MPPESLPPELAAIEAQLAAQTPASPSPEFRAKLLAAVNRELAGHSEVAPKAASDAASDRYTTLHRPRWGRFAAAMAAAILLGLNLALVAALGASVNPPTSPTTANALARPQLHALLSSHHSGD